MRRVLVTGGAGFIGSHLVEALLTRGDFVRVLDNFSSGRYENLDGVRGKCEIIEGDLLESADIHDAVQDIELIFHLAALVSVPESVRDPESCFATNVTGTVMLLEAARQAGIRKVVVASSTAVYGNPENFPTDEETPLDPLSPYAVSKQVDEIYARLYSQTLDLPVLALRYFNVYGPRQSCDSDYAAVIPIFLQKIISSQPVTIFGSGEQTRDFIFVKDAVRANLLAAESDVAGYAINICTGQETSILDLLKEMNDLTPHKPETVFVPPRQGDVFRSVGNPERAAQAINFHAEIPLSEGLKQTLDWIKKR